MSSSRTRRLLPAVIATGLLAACGFQLRGQTQLPFETLYIPGVNSLVVELKRNLRATSGARLVDAAADAQAVLGFTRETREKVILSYNAQGRVQEYLLRYRVGFRVTDSAGAKVYLPTSEIVLTREMSYSDALVLAKESEEALLFRHMQADMVQQILRRLVTARSVPVGVE
ncbi:MAG: LPS assembly lipoprotein LptE [Burkholderiales bacterium]